MSHELRTPLNAILGYTQILDGTDTFPVQHRKALATIAESGELLLTHINDILSISRVEAGSELITANDFHLHDLLQDLAAVFESRCEEKGLTWRLEAKAPSEAVRGDENKLRLVLIKLLSNAIKFTDHGSVTLVVHARRGDRYRFEVTDTGVGIQAGMEEEIFETFRQGTEGTNRGGTGLGLAISRHYVSAMMGELYVSSEPGNGSSFSFTVPLLPGRAPIERTDRLHSDKEWSRVTHLASGHAVKALVVDSIKTDRDILTEILTRVGIDVKTIRNCDEFDETKHDAMDIVFAERVASTGRGRDLAADGAPLVSIEDSVHEHVGLVHGSGAQIARPLRADQVYACVAQLLGVEYDYREPSAEDEPEPGSWRAIDLPEALYGELRAAIDSQSITELRKHIDHLEAEMGEAGKPLALHLRELARQYDMDGLRQALEPFEVNAV